MRADHHVTIALVAIAVLDRLVGRAAAGVQTHRPPAGDISAPGARWSRRSPSSTREPRPGTHTHFGEEIGYVIEGTFLIEQAGKPPVMLQAGGSFLIPAGTVHNATNTGAGPGKILATYIVEKGKPLATPAK